MAGTLGWVNRRKIQYLILDGNFPLFYLPSVLKPYFNKLFKNENLFYVFLFLQIELANTV